MRISDWSSDVCSSDLPCRTYSRAGRRSSARRLRHGDRGAGAGRGGRDTARGKYRPRARSDDPVDRLYLHHRATLGAALLDHDPVEPLDRVAAGGDAPAGNEGMNQRAQSAPDHRQPEARGDPEMLDVIFIDAFRMIDEQALEHGESFPAAAALAGAGDSGKASKDHRHCEEQSDEAIQSVMSSALISVVIASLRSQ